VQQLEVAVQQARHISKGPQGLGPQNPTNPQQSKAYEREILELKKKGVEDRDDLQALRSQLIELRNLENERGERGGGERGGGGGDTRRLKEENEKLRQELSAFDLDFFEEIENLKYAHSEAIKKLKVYEGNERGGSGR
jgi:hypothetical protein